MSCITIQIKRVNGIYVDSIRKDGISVDTDRVGGISLSIGLVCDVGLKKYIRVTPEEVQWITIDTSIDYNVLSNTDWSIT